jgi:hypothetical protein
MVQSFRSARCLVSHRLRYANWFPVIINEIKVARENAALPRFRSFQSISAYTAAYYEG